METVADFIFLGSKITADGDCSHEIKRHLLLGRKVTTNLDSILKNRDITLPTNVRLVKAMVFPVVMYAHGRGGLRYRHGGAGVLGEACPQLWGLPTALGKAGWVGAGLLLLQTGGSRVFLEMGAWLHPGRPRE